MASKKDYWTVGIGGLLILFFVVDWLRGWPAYCGIRQFMIELSMVYGLIFFMVAWVMFAMKKGNWLKVAAPALIVIIIPIVESIFPWMPKCIFIIK